ncbi:LETM1 [Lepeophtheirus salmonis]|uniref:LETM1 n=1 Tax=Lepeophtheirus salmonis TaxID=72036 RepID=A0A7R8HAX5_LEPSM|nr:LETM1 [Lepeophtheirus salmonis]CAF2973005.1 LETM1 [Lepeophtheirus salmonis]
MGIPFLEERIKQLVRTVSDLFRLLPFSVFVLVPFMEFLLPVALKLFPGMLPSTFTTSSERDNNLRRVLKAKLEYAKFLQKTLDEMVPQSKNHSSQVKSGEAEVKNEEILKFSKLFEDEITLDNMRRGQLVAICRLLELTPFGNNNFLRFQIEMKLRQLKTDDLVIQKEGIGSLSVRELQNACRERGMRAFGLSEERLKNQLSQWLDLSINACVPPSLLLLSRTLYLPETLDTTAQIRATISSLPEFAATQTKATIGEREGKIENITRLEVLKEEQRKIEEEALEEKEKRYPSSSQCSSEA